MKKHFIIVLFVLSMIVSGCRPVVMRIIGDEKPKHYIDAQIREAVSQLVATMRPIYRDYEKYRAIYPITTTNEDGSKIVTNNNRTYRVYEQNGEYISDYLFDGARPGDLGKIQLAFLGISDASDGFEDFFQDESRSIITEKVLAQLFLQKQISNNFMILERLSLGEDFDDWDNHVEDISENKNASRWAEVPEGIKDVSPNPEEKSADNDSKKYSALTIATKIAQKYKEVDVILTGFLLEANDYHELHLRMIETRQGQIVAVGSSRIKKETFDDEFGMGY